VYANYVKLDHLSTVLHLKRLSNIKLGMKQNSSFDKVYFSVQHCTVIDLKYS